MPKRLIAALLGSFLLLALASPAPAADKKTRDFCLIFGTVYGPDDRPLFGVKVKIRRADRKKAKWELYSDHRGEFAQRLPVGEADYVVWADLSDHSVARYNLHSGPRSEAKVHIENNERQDIGLHLIE